MNSCRLLLSVLVDVVSVNGVAAMECEFLLVVVVNAARFLIIGIAPAGFPIKTEGRFLIAVAHLIVAANGRPRRSMHKLAILTFWMPSEKEDFGRASELR